jgi:hypothetical protein
VTLHRALGKIQQAGDFAKTQARLEENTEPPSRERDCPICGDSFDPISSINIYCGKPECKRIRKAQLAKAKYPKRKV